MRGCIWLCALLAFGIGGCLGTDVPSVRKASGKIGTSQAQADSESTPGSTAAIYASFGVPIPELGYNAREGRGLYRHYCLNCHGDEGRGDGFNAFNLDPRPRSLADSTFQAQRSDADMIAAIRSGGSAVGLSTGMPPWGRTLNVLQIQDLVEYVRTLRTEGPRGD